MIKNLIKFYIIDDNSAIDHFKDKINLDLGMVHAERSLVNSATNERTFDKILLLLQKQNQIGRTILIFLV